MTDHADTIRRESDGDRMLHYRDNHLPDDAVIADECRRYALVSPSDQPLGAWALLRHVYNNRDAAYGGMRLACDGWEKRARDAEAERQQAIDALREIAEFMPKGDGGAEWSASVTAAKARAALVSLGEQPQ